MRCFEELAGLLAGIGLIAMGAAVAVGCGEDFEGCEAHRTCASGGTAGGGGPSGTAGADDGGSDKQGGGSGGSTSKGGASARGGSSGTKGGQGGRNGSSGSGTSAGEGGVNETNGASGEMSIGSGGASGDSGAKQDGAAGEAGGGTAPPEDGPPTVVSTTPSHKETGVRDDVEISITFSKPMNTESVKQAYVSEELPLGTAAQLFWTDNNTRLVITHTDPLEYTKVVSLDELPKEYRATISGTATDVAGHALGEDFKLPFYTLRDVTQDIARQGAFELTHPNDGSADTSRTKCDFAGSIHEPLLAGDDEEDHTLGFAMSFRDSDLPDGIVEWRSARVVGPFTTSAQNPFTRLGELWGYGPLVGLQKVTWSSPSNFIGSAAQFASQQRFDLDVLSALAAYYDNDPGYAFLVLFKFEHGTNADSTEHSVTADCDETALHVEYLVP